MKTSLNKIDDVNATIVVEVEKSDYQEKVNKSINQLRQRANIPGFRQGKVPKGIIEKMYGKSVLVDEINKIVSDELFKYIRENDLHVLGEPLPSESEENAIDFDKDEEFTFTFDVGLEPEFELSFDKRNQLNYYTVKLEDELIDKQMDAYKQNFGTYKTVEEPAVDTDLIKGVLTELENGEDKVEGLVIENAILMPSYVKDEETKNQFTGSKVGESVVFNPKKAYDNNEAEVASLLQTTKENIKEINSDFRFDIKEVTRYEEAEMNQELFDKVLGENAVTSEEEFRARIAEMLSNQFKPNADYLFIRESKEMILKKMKDVKFPDEFLKRWLLESDENKTTESVEESYTQLVEDLKYMVAHNKIVRDNNLKVESEDMEKLATEVARAQFAQYGMSNLPEEMLQNYAKSLLEKEETVRNIYERALENKVADWLKETVKINEKEVSSEEFNKLLQETAE